MNGNGTQTTEAAHRLYSLTEAPSSVNFILVSPTGLSAQWTLRDVDEAELFNRFVTFVKARLENKYTFRGTTGTPQTTTAPGPAATGEPGKADIPVQPPTTPTAAPQTVMGSANPIQTVRATRMDVQPQAGGKVKLLFYETGHRFPDVYATWPVERAVKTLAPTGAWTAQHMQSAETYNVSMLVEWTESENLNSSGKPYKNIQAVKPMQQVVA